MSQVEETPAAVAAPPDLREITARNIVALRTARKMTQLELGEALSYSDKSISKWERAEAVPDAYVLLSLSSLFGVSVDWLLTLHEEAPPLPRDEHRHIHVTVSLLSFFGIWTAATLAFVVLAVLGIVHWQVFVYALPVSLVTLLVFHSLWGRHTGIFPIVGLLVASLVLTLYVVFLPATYWQLFLILPPAELIVLLSRFLLGRRK